MSLIGHVCVCVCACVCVCVYVSVCVCLCVCVCTLVPMHNNTLRLCANCRSLLLNRRGSPRLESFWKCRFTPAIMWLLEACARTRTTSTTSATLARCATSPTTTTSAIPPPPPPSSSSSPSSSSHPTSSLLCTPSRPRSIVTTCAFPPLFVRGLVTGHADGVL